MKTSAICCARNRNDMLKQTLPSWLNQNRAFDEIVLVQWGGVERVLDVVQSVGNPKPVVVYEVLDTDRWVLTHAYNLAARLSRHPALYKLDTDYLLHPHFTTQYQITNVSRFFTGNWRMYPSCNTNARNINGCILISQRLFWSVGGYNERIVDYGYDDEDLYERLQLAGYLRLNLSYGLIKHIPHDDTRRACKQTHLRYQMVEQSKKIAHEQRWSAKDQGTEWCVERVGDNHYMVTKRNDGTGL